MADLAAPIEEHELVAALDEIHLGSAPGPSGVDYNMLRRLGTKAREAFLAVMNRALESGVVPGTWQTGTIIPLPKKPETDG